MEYITGQTPDFGRGRQQQIAAAKRASAGDIFAPAGEKTKWRYHGGKACIHTGGKEKLVAVGWELGLQDGRSTTLVLGRRMNRLWLEVE